MRPKPDVIKYRVDKSGLKAFEVLAAQGLWAVVYNGNMINLRTRLLYIDYPGPKYPRTIFANVGSAHRTCRKLRKDFKDDGFAVVRLTVGEVEPDPDPSRPCGFFSPLPPFANKPS